MTRREVLEGHSHTLAHATTAREIASRYRGSSRRESLIAVLPATTRDTFSGMQLKERPGPPGPYAAPAELAPARPDVSTGGTRYADIEYARVMGFRPLRMDLLLP